jgi:hypothetical protein
VKEDAARSRASRRSQRRSSRTVLIPRKGTPWREETVAGSGIERRTR